VNEHVLFTLPRRDLSGVLRKSRRFKFLHCGLVTVDKYAGRSGVLGNCYPRGQHTFTSGRFRITLCNPFLHGNQFLMLRWQSVCEQLADYFIFRPRLFSIGRLAIRRDPDALNRMCRTKVKDHQYGSVCSGKTVGRCFFCQPRAQIPECISH